MTIRRVTRRRLHDVAERYGAVDELSAILSQPYRRATPRELALYALADRIRRAFEVCR